MFMPEVYQSFRATVKTFFGKTVGRNLSPDDTRSQPRFPAAQTTEQTASVLILAFPNGWAIGPKSPDCVSGQRPIRSNSLGQSDQRRPRKQEPRASPWRANGPVVRCPRHDNDLQRAWRMKTRTVGPLARGNFCRSLTWPAASLWARLCERMGLWPGIAFRHRNRHRNRYRQAATQNIPE